MEEECDQMFEHQAETPANMMRFFKSKNQATSKHHKLNKTSGIQDKVS